VPWTGIDKSFDTHLIGIASIGMNNGAAVDLNRVMGAFAVQWVISNPDRSQAILQLYGSLDSISYYDLSIDVSLAAGGTSPAPAGLNTLAITTGKAARWVRAAVNLLSADPFGSPTADGITVTAIVVANDN
jgi:hypothetical protein